MSVWTKPNILFRETIFRLLGSAAPQMFSRARQRPRLAEGNDNFGTTFMGVATCTPRQIWEGKKVQNFARFWTHSKFDCEYQRNGSTGRQTENGVIN